MGDVNIFETIIIKHVLKFLSFNNLKSLRLVCRLWENYIIQICKKQNNIYQ